MLPDMLVAVAPLDTSIFMYSSCGSSTFCQVQYPESSRYLDDKSLYLKVPSPTSLALTTSEGILTHWEALVSGSAPPVSLVYTVSYPKLSLSP